MSQLKLGIIGGGQLGSMLSAAAKKINIKTTVYCDDINAPAQNFCDEFIFGKYDDKQKILEFINKVNIITFEFENIPYETLNEINKEKPVLPKPSINKLIQHRLSEKDFINKLSELLNEQEMIMEESFNEAANRGKFKQSSEGSGGRTSKEKQENLRNTLGNIMRDIGESENEIPQELGRADRAMRQATKELEKATLAVEEAETSKARLDASVELKKATARLEAINYLS